MPTHKRMFLFIAILILAPQLASAANVVVGKCIPKLQIFSTISAAVSSVPPGSTIYVCPGVYPEQVAILQPLTLRGVQFNNADRVVIAVPPPGISGASGLQINAASQATVPLFGFPAKVEAQVLVRTPGPVTISDITVDGTGANRGCVFNDPAGVWLVGVFYDTGSSGTVNRVTTRNQLDNTGSSIGCGNGIWAEDSTDPSQTIVIQNSDAHAFDNAGIFVGTDLSQEQQFAPTIIGNDVYGGAGIVSGYTSSTISNNNVHGGDGGIFALNTSTAGTSILHNRVSDSGPFGISASGRVNVRYNKISNVTYGIFFGINQPGIFAGNNSITNTVVGIEIDCATGTVGGPGNENTISDAHTGMNLAPPGFINVNHFHNVDTVIVTGGGPPPGACQPEGP